MRMGILFRRLPCDTITGKPIFAATNGNECWAPLVEKACAKFCGTYEQLDLGNTLWALQALTGDPVFRFKVTSLRLSAAFDNTPGVVAFYNGVPCNEF